SVRAPVTRTRAAAMLASSLFPAAFSHPPQHLPPAEVLLLPGEFSHPPCPCVVEPRRCRDFFISHGLELLLVTFVTLLLVALDLLALLLSATLDVVRDRDRGAFVLEPGDGRRQLGVTRASARVLDCRDPLSRRRPLARGGSRIVHQRPQLHDLIVGASH